jgi:type IV secretory pathway TrbD component
MIEKLYLVVAGLFGLLAGTVSLIFTVLLWAAFGFVIWFVFNAADKVTSLPNP